MELTLTRKEFTENSTIGELIFDDFFCFTLEDPVREEGVKVYGKTAIPEGRYFLVIDESARFKRKMPHILDVPGFEGIRIHAGNTAKDTEGCPLLGFTKGKDFVGNSRAAFNKFFDKLYLLLPHEECWITIKREVT